MEFVSAARKSLYFPTTCVKILCVFWLKYVCILVEKEPMSTIKAWDIEHFFRVKRFFSYCFELFNVSFSVVHQKISRICKFLLEIFCCEEY